MIGRYCMVRTLSAGVFAGTIVARSGQEVELSEARRMWYWAGAASLSELAVCGTKYPEMCKFPVAVPSVVLTQVIEIILISDLARKSIEAVPIWSA